MQPNPLSLSTPQPARFLVSGFQLDRKVLGDRLSSVLDLYESRKSAAEVAGVSTDQLLSYVKGASKPPIEVLARLAQPKGISLDWVAGASERQTLLLEATPETPPIPPRAHYKTQRENPDLVMIPRYDIKASAGTGAVVLREHDPIDHIGFSRHFMAELGIPPSQIIIIQAVGDSMEPTIYDRDYLMVHSRAVTVIEDQVYAISREGEVIVKRIQRFGRRGLRIVSDNPRYLPEELTLDDAVDYLHFIGPVLRRIGKV